MTLYLIKGYLDVAATSLSDAQSLYTALLDPSTATNSATIDRITGKLETLVQSDTGEPLVISSIDDAAGTISSWVIDAAQTLTVGLGDATTGGSNLYASTADFSIVGSTRTGILVLNTQALNAAVSGSYGFPSRGPGSRFKLHIRRTSAAGLYETVGLLGITVKPGVMQGPASDVEAAELASYVVAAQAAAASAEADAVLTAADRVQTGLDATATAADRVQTGLDRTAAAASAAEASADAATIQDAIDIVALMTQDATSATILFGPSFDITEGASPYPHILLTLP